MIGCLTKIAPDLTHLANLQNHIVNQMMLIDIDTNTALKLALHLKTAQLVAMMNDDEYTPILPHFEIYKTRISHGRAPSQVQSDVLGIKCNSRDAKLLGEFFTRLASETNRDHRDGLFLPRGAAYLLGTTTYAQILQDNDFFLSSVATIPVNLEYDAWFVPIDPNNISETDPISLYDNLLRQPWFLRVESVSRNKCLVVTTRPNLTAARAWLDANLEPLIRQSIPSGIEPPASLPRRLDKPVYTVASQTYADILKKQFSLASNPTTTATAATKPPRKRQATIIDYDSDQSTESPISNASTATHNSVSHCCNSTIPPVTIHHTDFATELQSLKNEILSLKTVIATAMEQIKDAIVSFQTTKRTPEPSNMDVEVNHSTDLQTSTQNPIDLPALIQDLKKDIANIAHETRTMFQQPMTELMNFDNLSSIT